MLVSFTGLCWQILDRKNAEIEEVKSHYRQKAKEMEECVAKLDKKGERFENFVAYKYSWKKNCYCETKICQIFNQTGVRYIVLVLWPHVFMNLYFEKS